MRSFTRTLAHSQACGKVSDYMSQIDLVLSHSEPGIILWSLVPVALQYFWAYALWSRKNQNSDVTFGPVACPFPHLLALLTHLLVLHRMLCSRTPLHSFIRSLAYSWAHSKVKDYMSQIDLVLSHSEPGIDLSSTSSVVLGVYALWSRKNENPNVTSGPLAHPFLHLLPLLTHLLALHRTLHSRALLHSFVCSLAHSFPNLWESEWSMLGNQAILDHSDISGYFGP